MEINAFDITDYGLTFVVDGVPWSADSSHPNFDRIRDELISPTRDPASLVELVDTRVATEGKTFGLVTVGTDAIWYKNQQINGYLVDKLLALVNVDITPWANLLDNLMRNPDKDARDRLPLFLEQAKMPITEDGHFLAWRLVKDDYWDINTGSTFHNVPGAVIQMPREHCDSNPHNTCSSGIHAAAFDYLGSYGFGDDGRRCMLVKINPEHVVAVPTDYSNQKLRCCEALILREVDKEKVPALFGRDDHVATEHGYVEDDGFDDDIEDMLDDCHEIARHSADLPIKPKKPSTNGRSKFYVSGEAGDWVVVRRSTGREMKKFDSRSKARAHAAKLNSH